MKTNKLSGAALDWAVAWAENITIKHFSGVFYLLDGDEWNPTRNWAQGGPIIEREKIDLTAYLDYWEARLWANREVLNGMPLAIATATLRSRKVSNSICMSDQMPLIAAMRCYVASKMDDEVEIPEELQ